MARGAGSCRLGVGGPAQPLSAAYMLDIHYNRMQSFLFVQACTYVWMAMCVTVAARKAGRYVAVSVLLIG